MSDQEQETSTNKVEFQDEESGVTIAQDERGYVALTDGKPIPGHYATAEEALSNGVTEVAGDSPLNG